MKGMAQSANALPVDPRQARAFIDRREAARQAALDRHFAAAQAEAKAVIALIAKNYHPRRILQWGSLLDRPRFWEQSDIDLAVEGVSDPELFFRMFGEASRLTSFPLDLVAMENVEPEFAELITLKGRIVYER